MIPHTLIISDLHAHTAWPFSKPLPNGRSSRFQDLLNVLDQVQKLIQKHQPTTLIIAGDLTHRRNFINFRLYNALYEALEWMAECVRHTVILVGNHDYEDDQTHSLYVLGGLPNTSVFSVPSYGYRLAETNVDLSVIPYLPDAAAMVQAFERAPSGQPVISHYAAEGVPLETDYWLPSPLKLGELDRFPLVFFGHVHRPSEQLDNRVVYVGAPMHFDFGDVGPRYAVLTDWETWQRLPLQAPVFSTVRWPRLPKPTTTGYVRILDVPPDKLEDAKRMALALGWLDAAPLPQALPPEIYTAITGGLALNRELLQQRVDARCPDLDIDERAVLVEEGLTLLREVTR